METRTYNVYTFEELSKEGKTQAIEKWREDIIDFPFLEEDLNYILQEKLKENKIKEEGETKLYFSLSYCQGDGVSFTGYFKWKNYNVSITRGDLHYYHEYSTYIDVSTKNDNQAKIEVIEEFKNIYYKICKELEKEGYSHIEYEESEECIKDIFKTNEYMFTEDGKIA